MHQKLTLIAAVLSLGTFAGLALVGAHQSFADKGGCPNAASANGAAHANPNSAHGPAKQEARGCDGAASPTPAAPTPPPGPPRRDPNAIPHPHAERDTQPNADSDSRTQPDRNAHGTACLAPVEATTPSRSPSLRRCRRTPRKSADTSSGFRLHRRYANVRITKWPAGPQPP